MSELFKPLAIGPLTLANRVIVAPMCQYSADEGQATDWHTIHLGNLALSGAGMLTLEATAVNPEGRISHADLGLYDDACEQALCTTLSRIRPYTRMPFCIQLAHAGRKASTDKPWCQGKPIAASQAHGWQTIAPSAIAFDSGYGVPTAATEADIAKITEDFVNAAKRAARLNLDAVELHAAHGYLLHQFLSPLSNQRSDRYGGSLDNRMRLLLEIVTAVRAALPDRMALGVRLSASDWVAGGWDLAQSQVLAVALEQNGCDFIHVSSAGLLPAQQIPVAPGFQVPLAAAIRESVNLPVIAVGLITEPNQAETIIASHQADAIAMARGLLYEPHWVWHAARTLGARVAIPPQYLRSEPQGSRPHLTNAETEHQMDR